MLGDVRVRLHPDPDDFVACAGDWYRRSPIVHTVELSLLRGGMSADEAPLLVTAWEDDELVGAAMQTPPLPMLCGGLSGVPADEAVSALRGAGIAVPGVRGPRRTAETLAERWRAQTGAATEVTTEERLYRLATLSAPVGVPGGHRVARTADQPVLIRYQCDFAVEAFGHAPDPRRAAAAVAGSAAAGHAYLLWTADGAPMSMAGVRAPAAGVSRIGPVYTPPEVRGRGFASAVTAAACRWALAAGARQVVLFADLANPTSNRVYRRLGFVPVGDSISIAFRVP
ncbi:GNAT family N-acetyltransferase [Mycobacterium sp. 852013-51886_SCH5428379]|uniref:GNAT family N-acetyltransferase n=1 Tax=Mycobacterium sp. 852013-51886_SCH5428379 TaxID=1834111 RepID=UPI000A6E0E30|nr:GNAT family N-acetyltransferase [Mycobacterium sp. 852013-51886_SCH5428379]